jgi:potassium efflux system protein
MTNLRRTVTQGAFWGTLAVLVMPVRALAQARGDTTEAAAASVAALRPIPTSEIISSADSLEAFLRGQAAAVSAPEDRIAEIDSLLPQATATVATLLEQSDSVSLSLASTRVFDDLRNRWSRQAAQLDAWQRTTERRSQQLDSLAERLDGSRAVWQMTADSTAATELPDAVRARVVRAVASIDSARASVRQRLDAVLTIQGGLSQARSSAVEALLRLDAAEGARRQQLFTPERPPLWRVFAQRDTTTSVASDLRRSWQRDRDVFLTFLSAERGIFTLRLMLFALVAVGLTILHRSGLAEADDHAEVSQALEVLARPVSAALLLFLLSGRLFHGAMPQVYSDVNGLLLMVPLSRMIPIVVPPRIRVAAYALVGIFAVQRLEPFFVSSTAWDRLIVLAVNLLVLAGLVWLVRMGRSGMPGETRWRRALLAYVRAGMVATGLALFANVFGLVDLAELLTSGIVLGLIAALLLVVGVVIVRATVRLTLRRPFALAIASVRNERQLILRRFDWVISFGAVLWWTSFMLDVFRVRTLVFGWVAGIVGASLTVGSIDVSVGDVLAFGLVVWASFQISRFVRFILREDVLPRVDLPRGVPQTITTVTNYVVVGLGFMLAVAAAGVDLSQLTLLVGAFGVGIGFGLQSIVNNFVSGLILLFERPIQVGDMIQVDTLLGTAERIGIRASLVRTLDGAEVIVPNADLVTGRVVNWSLSDRMRRFELSVGIAYGSDLPAALDLLNRIAREHDGVADEPPPVARFAGFGESSLDVTLLAWTSLDGWPDVASDLRVRVNAAFAEAGIEIPFPQRDLHVRSVEGLPGASPSGPNSGD